MPFLDRSRGLLYDDGVGYLYRVLPASLRVGLPPIGDRWGGFDQAGDAGTRRRLLGRNGRQRREPGDRAHGSPAEDGVQPVPATDPPGRPARTLYFLHVMLPHAPYRLLPSGREYGNAETIDGIQDDAFNAWGKSPCSSTRRSSATCCRSAIRIGCSGRFSDG